MKLTKMACAILMIGCLVANTNANENNENKVTTPVANAAPHCEVPCGIYADQRRFEEMLEDTKTIAKAIASINEISDGFQQGPPSAKDINQLTRWINNKESHATNVHHIVSQYFLTQRIKADNERYVDQLKSAHAVIVAAMKCKQDASADTAEKLKVAIGQLYRAYEGKDPEFEADHE